MIGPIHAAEFPTRGCRGIQFEDPTRRLGQFYTQFLGDLSERRAIHVVTGTDMARRGRIPDSGKIILPKRPLLKKQLTPLVEDQDMNSAVTQLQSVHLAARRLANDPVFLIHHIKPFLGHTARGSDRSPRPATAEPLCRTVYLPRAIPVFPVTAA